MGDNNENFGEKELSLFGGQGPSDIGN